MLKIEFFRIGIAAPFAVKHFGFIYNLNADHIINQKYGFIVY